MMRRTVQIVALMFAFSVPVTAGIMQCPVAGPTPPPPAGAVQETSAGGDINKPPATDETAADSLTETVLDLLAGVLALV
jgi:hypothetical protein